MMNMHNWGVADTDPAWHCLSHSGKTLYSVNCSTDAKMWLGEKKLLLTADFSIDASSVC